MKILSNVYFKISIFFFLLVLIHSISFSITIQNYFSNDNSFSMKSKKISIEDGVDGLKIEKISIYYKKMIKISNKSIKKNMSYSVNGYKLGTHDTETLLIYPNPASDLIQFDMAKIKFKPKKIEVFNIYGKLLMIIDDTNFDFYQNPRTIDVSTLIQGNYLLRITYSETIKSYFFEIIR